MHSRSLHFSLYFERVAICKLHCISECKNTRLSLAFSKIANYQYHLWNNSYWFLFQAEAAQTILHDERFKKIFENHDFEVNIFFGWNCWDWIFLGGWKEWGIRESRSNHGEFGSSEEAASYTAGRRDGQCKWVWQRWGWSYFLNKKNFFFEISNDWIFYSFCLASINFKLFFKIIIFLQTFDLRDQENGEDDEQNGTKTAAFYSSSDEDEDLSMKVRRDAERMNWRWCSGKEDQGKTDEEEGEQGWTEEEVQGTERGTPSRKVKNKEQGYLWREDIQTGAIEKQAEGIQAGRSSAWWVD